MLYQQSPVLKTHGRLSHHPNNTVGLDVKQLRQVMAEFENEERVLIETINTKYDLQANEIYDELFLRYLRLFFFILFFIFFF